ncbi:chemotaxis protein CheB [Actinosynnema sp. NPDC050436]|uniref:chemotaxis protein CheB n=1 Tax=Actinosynnema sp. NPDC050436 TaxID=3155659 RepID=UPI0033FBCFC3
MPEACRDVIVVGASAGGVEALRQFVSGLPADLAATVLVVLHLPRGATSVLPAILRRSSPLPVSTAEHGEPLRHGRVYTACPDHHLLVTGDAVALSTGPTENGHRPAVDALFRSAARALGPRVIGVVLSGTLDDGAAGLATIVARGGAAVVQDPSDALYPGMPQSALREVGAEHVVPAAQMGEVLAKLTREVVETRAAAPLRHATEVEADIAEDDPGVSGPVDEVATPSGFTCPECDGTLLELPGTDRYRCWVGHAWTLEALAEQKDDAVERALWAALRALDEKTRLAQRMRLRAAERDRTRISERYADAEHEATHAAEVLRALLRGQHGAP